MVPRFLLTLGVYLVVEPPSRCLADAELTGCTFGIGLGVSAGEFHSTYEFRIGNPGYP